MIRLRLLHGNFKSCFNFSRGYLSNEFKNVMAKQPELSYVDTQAKNMGHPLDLDLFINQLGIPAKCGDDVYERFLKLRKEAPNSFELTNHIILRHFIESDSIKELLGVLWARKDYGVFVSEFSGCLLMDILLKDEKEFAASQVAVQLLLQEEYENPLTIALSLQSCYGFLKKYAANPAAFDPPPNTEPEKKVRVKFLRNPCKEQELQYLIGKTMVQMAKKSPDDIRCNMHVLGHLFCEQYDKCMDLVRQESKQLHRDVLALCKPIATGDNPQKAELLKLIDSYLEQTTEQQSFDERLASFVNTTVAVEESNLISQQNKSYTFWVENREDTIGKDRHQEEKLERQANIENIMREINENQQKLWFFETEDKLELDIYKKKVYYPKRWFGKKKKPRVEDADYVPPEIIKKYHT